MFIKTKYHSTTLSHGDVLDADVHVLAAGGCRGGVRRIDWGCPVLTVPDTSAMHPLQTQLSPSDKLATSGENVFKKGQKTLWGRNTEGSGWSSREGTERERERRRREQQGQGSRRCSTWLSTDFILMSHPLPH